jgi:DNA replication protein DnaC
MVTTKTPEGPTPDLHGRAQKLGLWGLLANWEKVGSKPWIEELIHYEEEERGRRSLERRLRSSKVGRFKAITDFDWKWPRQIDRELVDELFSLEFIGEAANAILVGPNGVGKTMIAKNLAYQAILRGHTARFLTASELLNDLAAQESSGALMRRLRHYSQPEVLVIDEVGYLASSSEHTDLLFEVITRRYQEKSIVLTTNKPFREWSSVFPNSTCVVTLIDRLIHKAEVVEVEGKSYRLKEAQERAKERKERRRRKKTPGRVGRAPRATNKREKPSTQPEAKTNTKNP